MSGRMFRFAAALAVACFAGGCAGPGTRMGALPSAADEAHYRAVCGNYRDGRFFNQEAPALARTGWKPRGWFRLEALKLFLPPATAPAAALPMVRPERPELAAAPADFAVRWLGHSTLLFELAGRRFITDPVFGNASPVPGTMRRYQVPPLAREELPELDFVILSHDHYDHLEYDTIRAWRSAGMKFVAPLGVGAILRGWGIAPERIYELNWGDTVVLHGISITAQPARHFSGRHPEERNRTLWASFVIRGGGRRIFYSGDGGYGRHFRAIGERFGPFDLVCLEIDAWNQNWPNHHLFPAEVIRAHRELRGALLLPIHWGVFNLGGHQWDESIRLLSALADRENIPLATPKPGERCVPGVNQTSYWWETIEKKKEPIP